MVSSPLLGLTLGPEAFTFDLKSLLDPKTHDMLWKKHHRLETAHFAPANRVRIIGCFRRRLGP